MLKSIEDFFIRRYPSYYKGFSVAGVSLIMLGISFTIIDISIDKIEDMKNNAVVIMRKDQSDAIVAIARTVSEEIGYKKQNASIIAQNAQITINVYDDFINRANKAIDELKFIKYLDLIVPNSLFALSLAIQNKSNYKGKIIILRFIAEKSFVLISIYFLYRFLHYYIQFSLP